MDSAIHTGRLCGCGVDCDRCVLSTHSEAPCRAGYRALWYAKHCNDRDDMACNNFTVTDLCDNSALMNTNVKLRHGWVRRDCCFNETTVWALHKDSATPLDTRGDLYQEKIGQGMSVICTGKCVVNLW
jgi:hypothetical protein